MKYALVTGGSSGIGLAYVRQLAEMGYGIIIVSNQEEANHKVVEQIRSTYHVEAEALYKDLSEENSAQEIFDWCKNKNLKIDILVSNAGLLHFGKLVHCPIEKIHLIMAVHCETPAKLCRLFGNEMASRHEGHILIMSSITAWIPLPTISLYGATKAFLKNFSQSLWYELREEGVSVTTIFPSAVDTPFYQLEDKHRRRLKRCGFMLSPEELAHRALKAMFRRRRTYVPSFAAKIQVLLCRMMPAWGYVPLLKLPFCRRILSKL